MVTYEKLFAEDGSFVGFTVFVDGKHFETCEYYNLHEVVRRAECLATS